MSITYKNNSTELILNKLRDLRYMNTGLLYGFFNTTEVALKLNVDVNQISIQADVFARQVLTHRSEFDLKRFLGQYQEDWLRLLHEAYVYDRARAIYYGLNAVNLLTIPKNIISFPGHVLLFRTLSEMQYSYDTADQQPYSIYVKIKHSGNAKEILQPIFDSYPELEEGISYTPNVISYVNSRHDAILNGLFNASTYLNSRNKIQNEPLYEMRHLDDENIASMTNKSNNPLLNSFLSDDGSRFYYINPVSVSGPGKMRFNPSLYVGRGIGYRSTQLVIEENSFFNVAKRDSITDPFTREEVYAITGLKSEIIPYSSSQILEYLGINSYKGFTQKGEDKPAP